MNPGNPPSRVLPRWEGLGTRLWSAVLHVWAIGYDLLRGDWASAEFPGLGHGQGLAAVFWAPSHWDSICVPCWRQ